MIRKGIGTVQIRMKIETIETTTLLRWPKYSKESSSPAETWCHTDSRGSAPANAAVKNLRKFETHYIFCDFEIQKDHLILARRPNQVSIKTEKKRTWHLVDFIVLSDFRMKIKESEKKTKQGFYQMIENLEKVLEKRKICGRIEIIQISGKYWNESRWPENTCCHSVSIKRTLDGGKNRWSIKIIVHSFYSDLICFLNVFPINR